MEAAEFGGHFGEGCGELDFERLVLHAPEERVGGVVHENPAVGQDGDAVAQSLGLVEVVRGQEHGRAGAVEGTDVAPKLLAQGDIDPSAAPAIQRRSSPHRTPADPAAWSATPRRP